MEDIVFGDKWVLICSNATSGRIIYSSDLSTWTSVTTRDNVSWKSIAFSSGTYVAVGSDDQQRTMTPQDAINAGANYVVIGRPITQSWAHGAMAMKEKAHEIGSLLI